MDLSAGMLTLPRSAGLGLAISFCGAMEFTLQCPVFLHTREYLTAGYGSGKALSPIQA